jgi:hypothetical protein
VDDLVPATTVPLTELRRQQGIDLLRHLVERHDLDLERFESDLGRLLAATTESEFTSIIESLPPPFHMSSLERRLTEPLSIKALTQNIRLNGRWQVARNTTVQTGTGNITIDLTDAEFDDRTIDLNVKILTGRATILVPVGTAVQLVGETAPVRSKLQPPLPGYPLIRLSASAVTGHIRLRHPPGKEGRWRFRLRRTK